MIFARFFRFFRYLTWKTLKITFRRAGRQRLPGLASEMAYNAMLSLFPAILALLTAIGLFKPLQFTFIYLANQISGVIPEDAVFLIKGFAHTISLSKNRGLFSLSFLVALWTASATINAAMVALDQIHLIPLEKRRPFWKAKLVSLGLTIGTILLLITASFLILVSDFIVQLLLQQSGTLRPTLLSLWQLLSWPAALVITALAFAFIYRYGPSRWTQGTPIMPGAIVATISYVMFSELFQFYVSNFGNYNAVYGAIGTFIVLMLWLNFVCLLMLFGAQLNVCVGEAMRHHVRN